MFQEGNSDQENNWALNHLVGFVNKAVSQKMKFQIRYLKLKETDRFEIGTKSVLSEAKLLLKLLQAYIHKTFVSNKANRAVVIKRTQKKELPQSFQDKLTTGN